MNGKSLIFYAAATGLLLLPLACKKSLAPYTVTSSEVANAPIPAQMNFFCSHSVNYGDSIVFLQPTNGNHDYIIKPVNQDTLGPGTYFAWPDGLMIDSASGMIDLSQSQMGLRYVIGFVPRGTQDTCMSNLIVAGITYIDSIYQLSNNDTLAIPMFNANASVASVCDSSDDSDYPGNSGKGNGDNKCKFDGGDNSGKHKGEANGMNVKVRSISGVINLKATLGDGAFGTTTPANGATVTVPIYYTLNDNSKKAVQMLTVQLIYYDQRSDIPTSLLNTISTNRGQFYQNLPILFNNPRPPLILIVR